MATYTPPFKRKKESNYTAPYKMEYKPPFVQRALQNESVPAITSFWQQERSSIPKTTSDVLTQTPKYSGGTISPVSLDTLNAPKVTVQAPEKKQTILDKIGTTAADSALGLISGQIQIPINLLQAGKTLYQSPSQNVSSQGLPWQQSVKQDTIYKAPEYKAPDFSSGIDLLSKAINVGETAQKNIKSFQQSPNIVSQTVEAIPNTAAGIGLGLVNPVLGAGFFGASSLGAYAGQAEKEGATPDQQLLYGLAGAAGEVATEAIPFGTFAKFIKAPAHGIAKRGLQYLGSIAAETIQEMAMEPITTVAKRATYDKDAKLDINQVIEAGKGGALMSLILLGAGSGVQTTQNKAADMVETKDFTPSKVQDLAMSIEQEQGQPISKLIDTESINDVLTADKADIGTNMQQQQFESVKRPLNVTGAPSIQQEQPVTGSLIDDRYSIDLSSRNVKSFASENPEFAPFIQKRAAELFSDLKQTQKGERTPIIAEDGYISGYTGNKRTTSSTIDRILSQITPTPTYEKAAIALQAISENTSGANTALAKKIEMIIDEDLTNGYTTFDGTQIEPNLSYLILKENARPGYYDEWENRNQPTTLPDSEYSNIANTLPIDQYNPELVDSIEDINQLEIMAQNATEALKTTTDNMLRMNLQLFAQKAQEKIGKLRKTYANSMMNAPATQEMAQQLKPDDFRYTEVSNQDQWDAAINTVNSGGEKSFEEFMSKEKLGGNKGYDTAVGEALLVKYSKEKNFEKFNRVATHLSEMMTDAGQTVQAMAILKRLTPEGMLYYQNQKVEEATKEVLGKNKGLKDKVDKGTKELTDAINQADNEAIDEVIVEVQKVIERRKPKRTPDGKKISNVEQSQQDEKKELTPAELLARRIENAINPRTEQEKTLIQKMVNELFAVAKPKLPIQERTAPNVFEDMATATTNRQLYADTWAKARSIVKEDLKDNPEALNVLDEYFSTKARPVFDKKKLEKAIKETMDVLDINMDTVVRNMYKEGRKSREEIKSYILEKTELSGEDAEYISTFIENRLKELTKQKREAILKRMFPDEVVKAEKQLKTGVEKISEITNLGAFVNQNYKDKVYDKLKPAVKQAMLEAGIDIETLVKMSANKQSNTAEEFALNVLLGANVDKAYYDDILDATGKAFDELAKEKREKILANIVKERKVAQKKSMAQRIDELNNMGVLTKGSQIEALVREKYGLPSISQQEANLITEIMDDANEKNYDSMRKRLIDRGLKEKQVNNITNEQLEIINVQLAMQMFADKMPTDRSEKSRSIRRIMMLANPKTQVRNVGGNLIFNALEDLNQVLATGVDTAVSAITGDRTTALPSISAKKSGAQEGIEKALIDYKLGIDTSPSKGAYEMQQSKKIFRNKALNDANNALSFIMMMGDRPFYQAAYNDRIKQLEKLGKPIDDQAVIDATEYALERVFQNEGVVSQIFTDVRRGLNKVAPFGFGLVDMIIPFVRTPANILEKGIEYSPLGILKAVKVVSDSGKKGFNQKKFVDSVSRSLTGTGIAALGYLMAKSGIASGEPEESEKKKALGDVIGKQKYSFKIGDTYYPFDWSQPASIPLSIGIAFQQAGKTEAELSNQLSKGLIAGGDVLLNQSMIQGLKRLLGGYTPTEGVVETLATAPTQYLPTFGGQIAATSDPYKRRYDNILDSYKAKIPGVRQTMLPKIDIFGNEVLQNQGKSFSEKILENFVSPMATTKESRDPVVKELYRLSNTTETTDFIPKVAPKSFSIDEVSYKLTPEQQNEFQKKMGKQAYADIKEFIQSNDYKQMQDDQRIEYLSRIVKRSYDDAKADFIANAPKK